MLQLWEEIRTLLNIGRIIVTLQGTLKVETGDKWHILSLVDNTR